MRASGNAASSDLPPPSSVPKYTMPESTYETLPETVLAYKKANKIGRFNPAAPEIQQQKVKELWEAVEERSTSSVLQSSFWDHLNQGIDIKEGSRCCLSEMRTRRGSIAFVGPVQELPGLPGAPWIGIALDEPTGKNDGSIQNVKYFHCGTNMGIFVRPDRVEVGNFGLLDLEEEDPDMEEI